MKRACPLLHVHASVREGITELVFEYLKDRNALFFLCIALAQQIADLKSVKERRNRVKELFSVLVLW